ncbi:MAG TPA: hypothetical protein VJV23_13055 [Candidatus Polarisedimenticolia bacterium]|nr:hypothetical protein [Candidatus Polarisedimenticolia bacterium]
MKRLSMLSGSRARVAFLALLACLLTLWPGRAAAFGERPRDPMGRESEARERLTEGFRQILRFFAQHELSLLAAWREMRSSADPDFFEHRYPEISREMDAWAAALEAQFGGGAAEQDLDFTFLLQEFAPVVLSDRASSITRDNALATICMVCVMDRLRCEPALFHRFLASVVADDPSVTRKAEALRWLRRSGGAVEEGILEKVLGTSAALDPDVRSEAAKLLFGRSTRASLSAQRRLLSTVGLPPQAGPEPPRIACAAMDHFADAGYEEATPDLLAALDDPSSQVRACAADALGRLSGRPMAFDPAGTGPLSNDEAKAGWRSWWGGRGAERGGGR